MRLVLIENIDDAAWDAAISHYETKFLFHESVWLHFLERTQPGRVLRMRIEDKGKTIGYFAGLFVKKGPFKVLGSPLPGTTTEYMGPAAGVDLNQRQFLQALDNFCSMAGIHDIEMRNPCLDTQIMREFGFEEKQATTLILPLEADLGKMLMKLDKKIRYYVKKGPRDGILVEDIQDSSFINEYYHELVEVFARQGLVPSYNIERVRHLWESLKPNHIFPIKAIHNGKTLATGIFVHDDRRLYFWGGASWQHSHHLYPNEPVQWKAITLAIEKGVKDYDMGGGTSHFKAKFGGEKVTIPYYSKCNSPAVRLCRKVYESGFRGIQKIRWYLNRLSAK